VFNALELLMVVGAFFLMAMGLARRWCLPASKHDPQRSAAWSDLLRMVLGQKKLLARPMVGLAHLFLVWGFMIFILIVILAQTPLKVTPLAAQVISLLLDVTGFCMLAAVLFFVIRRIVIANRRNDLRLHKRTLLPLVGLLAILLSGFFAEGTRFNLIQSQNTLSAPVGYFFSAFLPDTPKFMQIMIRLHFVFVILFVATIPFTFMRHLASTSVHILYKENDLAKLPSALSLDNGPLGAGSILDFSRQQLREAEACVSCGRCDEQCPALISGKPLTPSVIMGKIVDQMEALSCLGNRSKKAHAPELAASISPNEIWACTTCMACVEHCPALIRPMDKILELRRYRVLQLGQVPTEATAMIRNLELFGDVNGKGPAHKVDWALNRNVFRIRTKAAPPPEVLLWVGCSGAFHPAHQQTTRALVSILQAAEVDFRILAENELCCGDPARKLGDEALFIQLARKNIHRFKQCGITRIVTLCPHCFNTLGREYRALGCGVEVLHASEMVVQLIKCGRIALKYPFVKSVAIHDPCYLGRYNGIYEPLRQVCRSVPGVTLKELPRTKDKGFCCGGGGGRMWLHENIGQNINLLRAREVVDSGVAAVATACPYCLTMMEDGIKGLETENPPEVIDIIQLAADALS
jgi:Fe-S oxidoreductase/nitrate reductase gamma subunit